MNMKRLFSLVMALAMALSLASVAMAAFASPGEVYMPDPDERSELISAGSTLVPGKTYFVYLEDAATGSSKPASRVSARDIEVYRYDTDKKISMMPSSLPVVRRRTGPSQYAWFAEMAIKNVSGNDYPDDGYDITGQLELNNESISLTVTSIGYEEGSGELTRDPQFFNFDDTYDEEIYLSDGESRVIIDSKGVKSKLLLAMNTDYNSNIAEKYPSANIDFFNGNGATFKKTAEMYIIGNEGDFLYELKDGKLTDLTRNWDDNESAFVFKTRTLGTYLRSDRKLDGAVIGSSSSAPSSSSSQGGSSSSGNVSVDALSSLISANFSNKFSIIAYGDKYENIGSTVTLKCQLDLSGLNTKTLVIYAYDEANNRLLALGNAGAYVDATGNMFFKTAVKGRYVITDSPLKAK